MITLTKLKRAGGEETPRFEAVLMFESAPVAFVSNSGTGGACRIDWIEGRSGTARVRVLDWARVEAARLSPDLFKLDDLVTPNDCEGALDYLVLVEVSIVDASKKLDKKCAKATLYRLRGEKPGVYRVYPKPFTPDSFALTDPRVAVVLNTLSSRDRVLRIDTQEAT